MRLVLYFLTIITTIQVANATENKALEQASAAPFNEPAASNAKLLVQMEDLQNQLKKLRGDVEQTQFDLARINERLVKFSADVEFRFNQSDGKESKKATDDILEKLEEAPLNSKIDADNKKQNAKNDNKITTPVDSKAEKQAYYDAYQLIKESKFSDAKSAFQEFINNFPNSDLTANAYFWIGEVESQNSQFNDAAVSYLKGYQVNVRGSRAPDNLYKLSKTLSKLGKRKEACVTLGKLKKEYPDLPGSLKKQSTEDFATNRCE